MVEYKISESEINRRKKAFLALSIFLIVGLFLTSIILKIQIFTWVYITYFLVLIISNLWISVFFKSLLRIKIYLSKEVLERKKNDISEKFLIKDIEKIKIKRTVKDKVREIYIYLKNNKSIFLNGLENFEKFTENLINSSNKNTIIKIIREPIDFDSVFFYPILGLILSFFTGYLFKILYSLSFETMKIVSVILLIYVFLVSVFFIFSKPISKRYGK